MIRFLGFFSFLFSFTAFGQDDPAKQYREADALIAAGNLKSAYVLLKSLASKLNPADTLYPYILWSHATVLAQVEQRFRYQEQFDSALFYARESLAIIGKGKSYFKENFPAREAFMIKNIVVSFFGLGRLDSVNKYKDIIYARYRNKTLPKGIDEYFNFSFFRWDNRNVWGYEWFEDLPEDRLSKSFSKIVYYVYSTNPDGSDKDQLYRLHVLMFHKIDSTTTFDYVLTKRLETAKNEPSGTLYDYTYTKDIDYSRLQADIREVLKGNYQPRTKAVIKKDE